MSEDPPAESQVRQALLDVIVEVLPTVSPAQITDDKTLRDLGADSVDRVEIVVALQERIAVHHPLSTLAVTADIGALVALLSKAPAR